MEEGDNPIERLQHRLDALQYKHDQNAQEIQSLRREIHQLRTASPTPDDQLAWPKAKPERIVIPPVKAAVSKPAEPSRYETFIDNTTERLKSDFEKFIGENLISKIGIAITVLGVAIGAKYAIDHELISPLTRIIMGYLMGLGLLGFSFKLRSKYEHFSAVLLSGAMAIFYFITFAGYSFYGLFPQEIAFGLMVIFTIFTVLAALKYDNVVIAHFGLIGAYAVPFLLSDGSGNVQVLFIYMAIVNAGILTISFKKYWKSLLYVAFGLTWLIFLIWYIDRYSSADHFMMSLVFGFIYFAVFYAAQIISKLSNKLPFTKGDIVVLLLNAFIFYGIGFDLLETEPSTAQFLGLFTLFNSALHALIATMILKRSKEDKGLFYLVMGLVIVFITIAIPVQLDGNWVTLLWIMEAALLFWIGRTKEVPVYEKMSYPLIVVGLAGLVYDWTMTYGSYDSDINFLFNLQFLSSLLFVGALGLILYIDSKNQVSTSFSGKRDIYTLLRYGIAAIFLFVLYKSIQLELDLYWDIKWRGSKEYTGGEFRDESIPFFKGLTTLVYSLVFLAALSWVNIYKIKSQILSNVNIILNLLAIAVFLTSGLLALSELREMYISQSNAEYFARGASFIMVRYICYLFFAGLVLATYKYVQEVFNEKHYKRIMDMLIHGIILWLLTSELIHCMDLMAVEQSYKLGISILWGVYALVLIALGIAQRKKYLRLAAIGLFGLTLAKLFFYDIASLNTIAKTIVFVSLGILLLVISFLYNKYKHIISHEE